MRGVCLSTSDLLAADKDDMFTLLKKHFNGVHRDAFEADLMDKSRVILFRDEEGLKGFSTFVYYTSEFNGEKLGIVYSGDTIIDPSAWGSFELPKTWIKSVRELGAQFKTDRQFWLLIVSGFRTYRFLPVFWKSFYPRYDQPTPADVKHLLNHLARERFGKLFDPWKGTVVLSHPYALSNELSIVPESRSTNPHVSFFHRANPGWRRGDELVCLTEVSDSNLTSAGERMVFGRKKIKQSMRA